MNLTDKIARCVDGLSGSTIIEIGPGPGGLTRSLLKTAKKVVVVEYDERAVRALADLATYYDSRLKVVQADALDTNLLELVPGESPAIVANLPYNIATPLLLGWIKQLSENSTCYKQMLLMFQKEVADRIIAKPGNKSYGRLSVMSQYYCNPSIEFVIPPSAFVPPPKVKSALVKFNLSEDLIDGVSFEALEKVTASAFGQRRKMVKTSLKEFAHYFEQCGISADMRAENITVKQYANLARLCSD